MSKNPNLNRAHVSAGLFCFLYSVLDFLTTFIVIELLGGIELNPIAQSILNYGWGWLFVIKATIPTIAPALVYFILHKHVYMPTLRTIWIVVGCVQLLAVIFNTVNIIYGINHL